MWWITINNRLLALSVLFFLINARAWWGLRFWLILILMTMRIAGPSIEIDVVLASVCKLKLYIWAHERVLHQYLEFTNAPDPFYNIQLFEKPARCLVQESLDLLLVLPAFTATVQSTKLMREVKAKFVFLVQVYHSMWLDFLLDFGWYVFRLALLIQKFSYTRHFTLFTK